MSRAFVMMGVSGCGKTTVGRALAEKLDCPFYDGDDFHPPENVAKMAGGMPLNDEDRYPWLAILHNLLAEHVGRGETIVIACSALKKIYRDQLHGDLQGVQFVYLVGSFDLIWQRMEAREGHYMKAEMLQSQFDVLETPEKDEALAVSIEESPSEIVNYILTRVRN